MRKYLVLSIFLSLFPLCAGAQPAAVTDLSASSSIEGLVDLQWTTPDPGNGSSAPSDYSVKFATGEITAADYNLSWVNTYSHSWTTLVSSGSTEKRTLFGLTPGATLYFAIKVFDGSTYGVWQSSTQTGGTNNTLAWTVVRDTPSVLNLNVSRGNAIVDLAWTANGETIIAGYAVERSSYSSTMGFVTLATILTPGTTHQDTVSLLNGNTYYYRVCAQDDFGNHSAYSTVKSTMPWIALEKPQFSGETTGNYSTNEVKWGWTATNAQGYRITNSSSGVNLSGNLSASTTSWIQSGLSTNTSYMVYLEAFSGLITSVTVSGSLFTLARPPGADTGTSTETTSSINLSWYKNGNPDYTRYTVLRSTDNYLHTVTAMSLTPSTTFQDTGRAEGTTYWYQIWAVNEESVPTTLIQYSTCTLSIAPAQVTFWSWGSGSIDGDVNVRLRASGDDGTVGQCSMYVVKWATYTITENNFAGIPVSSAIAATQASGQPEPTHTIGDLNPGTTYYFAFRVYDEVGNFSPISDVESIPACDKPPLSPTSVTAVATSSYTVTVSWTLPSFTGVDDRDRYKIYRATFAFTSFQPAVSTFTTAGNDVSFFNDTGLNAETSYYYRVSCLDKGDQGNGLFSEVGESPLSQPNNYPVRTPDTTPPAPITQISASPGVTEGKIDLKWVATGDDGSSGAITGGKFRLAWNINSLTNFTTSSFDMDITTSTTPGTTNTVTINSLGEGVTYYFRIWTADESNNWSPVSAGATSWSQIDVTPPAAVTNLAATQGWRRVTLTWTAPGDDGSSNTLNGSYDIRASSTGVINNTTTWNAASSGYPYRIPRSTQAVAGASQMLVVTGLSNGTTYYFALRSADERGNISDLSTVSPSATPVDNTPGVFSLQLPADNTFSGILNPTLSWAISTDADSSFGDTVLYTVVYSTDSSFSPGAATTVSVPGLIDTSYMPTLGYGSYEDKTLYWKVTAIDNDGIARQCTEQPYWRLRINSQNSAPSAFALSAPATGYISLVSAPTLSWNVSNDVDYDTVTYRVDYSRDNFSTYTSATGILTNYYTTPSLVENATYWWRVWAGDGTASTPCNATFYFKVNVEPSPPEAFILISPTDNYISSMTTTMTFSWHSTTDPDPDESVTYDLSWSESQEFLSSTTISGLTATTTTHAGFSENGIYYWRITAVGTDGLRRQSTQTLRFYVDTRKELPGAFDLLEPGYNVTISTTLTPLFSWGRAVDPDPADDVRYIIDMSPSHDFTGLGTVAVDRGADRYYVPLIGLTDQTTYYWRVRAAGYQGNPIPYPVDPGFVYSSTGVFVISMVNNPPEGFALSSPANTVNISTKKPTFKWGSAYDRDVGASVTYSIFIASAADFSVILESATGLAATSYDIRNGLLENRRYYWKVKAADNKSAVTDCSAVFSFNIPILNTPRAPAGLKGALAADKMSFNIQWSPVLTNSDNSAIDDLAGYMVYRGLSYKKMALFAFVAGTASSWTDNDTQGGAFYYRLRAIDTSGIESSLEDSPLLNSLSADTLSMMSEDSSLSIDIPPAVARLLLAENNAYHCDLAIQFERDLPAENDTTLLSYRIKVTKSDGSSIGKISFDQPLFLKFNYEAGTPAAARLAAAKVAPQDQGNLNVFWNNGIEYLRLGGASNTSERNVTLKAIKPGEYQLRRVSRPTAFRVSTIDPPKLFTPGVAPYEKITFYVDNPDGDKVVGRVFDLRSELTAELRPNGDATSSNVILEWDGQTSDSGPAPKGVYIYQIEGSGKTINGTIMIAR
jgi:hypothetical protein